MSFFLVTLTLVDQAREIAGALKARVISEPPQGKERYAEDY